MQLPNLSAMQRRLVSFAGSSVAIEYKGVQAAAVVDFLYQQIPTEHNAPPPSAAYRIMPGDCPGEQALYRDGILLYTGPSTAQLAELLQGDICYHLAAKSQGGLMFHAAGLAWQRKGLLMPGEIGAGKTTLAAWLTAQGMDYLTDELIFIADGTDYMQSFSRPLNVKASARPALARCFDFRAHADEILSSSHATLVPHTLLNPTSKQSEAPITLVLFPTYRPKSDFVLLPLSNAQTGLSLMRYLVNARNLSDYGFAEIARLAQIAQAYTMQYGDFDQIEGHIEALLSATNDNGILNKRSTVERHR